MASKLEKLQAKAGATVRQSIGQDRPGPAVVPMTPAGPASKDAGLRRTDRAYREIPLGKLLADPAQPRKTFEDDELDELAASLKARGQLQPARCYWSPEADRYVLVYGEKRLRAATRGGLESLVCEILPAKPDEGDVLEEQLAENGAGRSAVPPVEEGEAYIRLLTLRGWTEQQLADRMGVSQTTVNNRMALARLPEPVKLLIRDRRLSTSTAAEILRAPEDLRADLAVDAANAGLTRDQVRSLVGEILNRPSRPAAQATPPSPDPESGDAPADEVTPPAQGALADPDPSTLSWLTGCPPDDTNFKGALDRADLATVRAAIHATEGRPGHVKRVERLRARAHQLADELAERLEAEASGLFAANNPPAAPPSQGLPRQAAERRPDSPREPAVAKATGKPAPPPQRPVSGWLMHADGTDTEAIFEAPGRARHEAYGVNVYLPAGGSWDEVVKALDLAKLHARYCYTLTQIGGGGAGPGDRVRVEHPGDRRHGKEAVVLDLEDSWQGGVRVRFGPDAVDHLVASRLRRVDR